MRRTITAILLLLGVLQLWACAMHEGATQPVEPIAWRTLAAGKTEALERNMPVLVDFYVGPMCPRCNRLDQYVYGDAEAVARINRDFVPVRIDLSKILTPEEEELSKVLGTGGECMLAFLDPKGNAVTDVSGERICTMEELSKREFLEYLDRALARIKH